MKARLVGWLSISLCMGGAAVAQAQGEAGAAQGTSKPAEARAEGSGSAAVPPAARRPGATSKKSPSTKQATTSSHADSAAATGEVRRDPNGIKGISPFWEAVKRGDSAYVARDYTAAIEHYRQAITKSPREPLGHLRIAEAHLKANQLDDAEAAAAAALRFAVGNPTLQGKAMFLLATVQETKKAFDEALGTWSSYEKHAAEHSNAKLYPETPRERKKRIEAKKKLDADYAAVRERIEQRLKEADEKARKDATK